jgi:YVTN family beta-propeller protein
MRAPTIPVGDEPIEAAVDAQANRVYVTNHASKTVSVIDGATNAVVTEVRVGKKPVSVAVNPVAGRVCVVNQADNRLSVIDTATNAEVANIRPSQ